MWPYIWAQAFHTFLVKFQCTTSIYNYFSNCHEKNISHKLISELYNPFKGTVVAGLFGQKSEHAEKIP